MQSINKKDSLVETATLVNSNPVADEENGKNYKVKISVIVPVYNAEKYLHRCIDSILAQTYSNFELILINDGSKDSSGKISDEYAHVDSRIRVFHKENGGVSTARNFGLDKARGEFITFIDSDDWVEENYLSHLLGSENSDFRISQFWVDYSDGMSSQSTPKCLYNKEISVQTVIDSANVFLWNICCKLYRGEIIRKNNLRFKEGLSMGEDTFFNYSYLSHCDSIILYPCADYHYIQDNCESLSKSNLSSDNVDGFLSSVEGTLSRFHRNIDVSAAENLLTSFILGQILKIEMTSSQFKKYMANPTIKRLLSDSKGKGKKKRIFDKFVLYGLPSLALVYSKKIGGVY